MHVATTQALFLGNTVTKCCVAQNIASFSSDVMYQAVRKRPSTQLTVIMCVDFQEGRGLRRCYDFLKFISQRTYQVGPDTMCGDRITFWAASSRCFLPFLSIWMKDIVKTELLCCFSSSSSQSLMKVASATLMFGIGRSSLLAKCIQSRGVICYILTPAPLWLPCVLLPCCGHFLSRRCHIRLCTKIPIIKIPTCILKRVHM